MPINRSTRSGLLPLLAFALVVLAQLPLVLNPGYFSHDELQWAAHAVAGPRATSALEYHGPAPYEVIPPRRSSASRSAGSSGTSYRTERNPQ